MNTHGTDGDSVTVGLPKGFTYFVRDGDMIKIGSSMRPEDRISGLQTASARALEVLAIVSMEVADEFETHQLFAHLRVRGEWFRAESELLSYISTLKTEPAKPRHQARPPAPKPAPLSTVERMVAKLTAARPSAPPHKRHHISNLIEQLRNHARATDPGIRSFLEGAMARSMASIEAA